MQKRKLQVFVSSTFIDLEEERQTAVQAILRAGHIPAGMELFKAGDKKQWEIIKKWIDESDVYMLIIGARYGSLEPESGKSYTQLEYEYAVENQNKPFFPLILSDSFIDEKRQIEDIKKAKKEPFVEIVEQNNIEKFKSFQSKVGSSTIRGLCNNHDQIKYETTLSLTDFLENPKITGWVRAKDVNYDEIAGQLAKLTKENEELRKNQTHSVIVNGIEAEKLKSIMINKTFFEKLETDHTSKGIYIEFEFPKGFDNMFSFFCEYYDSFEHLNPTDYNSAKDYFKYGVSYLRNMNLLSRESVIYKSFLTDEAVKLYLWHLSTLETE